MKQTSPLGAMLAAAMLSLPLPGPAHAAPAPKVHGSAVMMLALPGRGAVLSAPGETATIIIEGANGRICRRMKVRSGSGGLVQIPIAQTRRCPSARIVVLR